HHKPNRAAVECFREDGGSTGAHQVLTIDRNRRPLPPHPGPLPPGEGERWLRLGPIESPLGGGRLRKKPTAEPSASLSLGERGGVRGNNSSVWSARPESEWRPDRIILALSKRFDFHIL